MLSIDITSPTLSVGYAANSVPRVAKQKAVSAMEITSIGTFIIGVSNMITPMASGKHAMTKLYRKPLRLSPDTNEYNDIGAESRRSKVFTRRSIGIDTGSIDEAKNRSVIEIIPGIRVPGGVFFPMANARNIKSGKKMPETMILGLK